LFKEKKPRGRERKIEGGFYITEEGKIIHFRKRKAAPKERKKNK